MKKIIYTEHLLFRLKTREIPRNMPKEIYNKGDNYYWDKITQLNIAVKDIGKNKSKKTFMVAFAESNDIIKLITIHPLKSGQELNRVYSGRWQKTKKII